MLHKMVSPAIGVPLTSSLDEFSSDNPLNHFFRASKMRSMLPVAFSRIPRFFVLVIINSGILITEYCNPFLVCLSFNPRNNFIHMQQIKEGIRVSFKSSFYNGINQEYIVKLINHFHYTNVLSLRR